MVCRHDLVLGLGTSLMFGQNEFIQYSLCRSAHALHCNWFRLHKSVSNQLTGSIPLELGMLTKLWKLHFRMSILKYSLIVGTSSHVEVDLFHRRSDIVLSSLCLGTSVWVGHAMICSRLLILFFSFYPKQITTNWQDILYQNLECWKG